MCGDGEQHLIGQLLTLLWKMCVNFAFLEINTDNV